MISTNLLLFSIIKLKFLKFTFKVLKVTIQNNLFYRLHIVTIQNLLLKYHFEAFL